MAIRRLKKMQHWPQAPQFDQLTRGWIPGVMRRAELVKMHCLISALSADT